MRVVIKKSYFKPITYLSKNASYLSYNSNDVIVIKWMSYKNMCRTIKSRTINVSQIVQQLIPRGRVGIAFSNPEIIIFCVRDVDHIYLYFNFSCRKAHN